MGKRKHLDKIERLFENNLVVDSKSVFRIIGSKKNNYTRLLLHNLLKKGKIISLAKGFYTAKNDVSLAVFCFKPSYLGLQSALSYHKLWEQETIPIIITSKKVRPGIRKIAGKNLCIRRISKKYLFGFEYYKESFYLPYSDIEKTLIDMVVFKQKISKETLQEIIKTLDIKKLSRYLKHYPGNYKKIILTLLKNN